MNDRAVSEAIGFVLVFALVTATIGIVYASGFAGLYDAREVEQVENMVRAYDVLSDNVEELYRENAPSRSTELKLAGGTLTLDDSTRITITAVKTDDPLDNTTYSRNVRPIVYSKGRVSIGYELGAVLRAEAGSSVMLEQPGWLVDDRRLLVPFPVTKQRGNSSTVGGQGTFLVVTHRAQDASGDPFTTGSDASDPDVNVSVTVEASPFQAAWSRYLADKGFTKAGETADSVTYHYNGTDAVFVPQTRIDVELTR